MNNVKITTLYDLIEPVFKLPEISSVSKFADKYRYLSATASSSPGRFNTDFVPYLRECMDVYNDPYVRYITLLFGSQLGKTTAFENILFYAAKLSPMPAMWVLPDEATKVSFFKHRLKPSLVDSPAIKEELADLSFAAQQKEVEFRQMTLKLVIASSSAQLSMSSIGLVICDEIDKYPSDTKGEGNPLDQVRKRMRTFPFGKMLQSSTPTDTAGNISVQYKNSDQRVWRVPCPKCGNLDIWNFTRDVKVADRPTDIHYKTWCERIAAEPKLSWWECHKCSFRFHDNATKREMNSKGTWHKIGQSIIHAGFHLPSLASPFTTIRQLAANYIEAKCEEEAGDNTKLKDFHIHELAIPFEEANRVMEVVLKPEYITSYYRGKVPDCIDIIICAIDKQQDRCYWLVMGFGKRRKMHVIDNGVASSLEMAVEACAIPYQYERDNATIFPTAIMIDSGFKTHEVYEFIWDNFNSQNMLPLYPVRGRAEGTINKRIVVTEVNVYRNVTKDNSPVLNLYTLNTDNFKDIISTMMSKPKTEGNAFTVHRECDEALIAHLSSEHCITVTQGTKTINKWVLRAKSTRNDWLDCCVYALAGYELFGQKELEHGEKQQTVIEVEDYLDDSNSIEVEGYFD